MAITGASRAIDCLSSIYAPGTGVVHHITRPVIRLDGLPTMAVVLVNVATGVHVRVGETVGVDVGSGDEVGGQTGAIRCALLSELDI